MPIRSAQGPAQKVEVGWQYGSKDQMLSRDRVFDPQQVGMERLSFKILEGRLRLRSQPGGLGPVASPIYAVAQEGMADRRQVDPDLVGAPGLKPAVNQAGDGLAFGPIIPLQHLQVRDRCQAARAHRNAL